MPFKWSDKKKAATEEGLDAPQDGGYKVEADTAKTPEEQVEAGQLDPRNPPAYPVVDPGAVSYFFGMTLLDYYAGQALTGIMASHQRYANKSKATANTPNPEFVAEEAFAVAKAFLYERRKYLPEPDSVGLSGDNSWWQKW